MAGSFSLPSENIQFKEFFYLRFVWFLLTFCMVFVLFVIFVLSIVRSVVLLIYGFPINQSTNLSNLSDQAANQTSQQSIRQSINLSKTNQSNKFAKSLRLLFVPLPPPPSTCRPSQVREEEKAMSHQLQEVRYCSQIARMTVAKRPKPQASVP